MPEGDTLFRASRDTASRALSGDIVTGFESVLPKLSRVDFDVGWWANHRRSGGTREMDSHDLLRGPDFADAHADERNLAHLPARRA